MASHEHEKDHRGTVDYASDTSVGGNEHLNGQFSIPCWLFYFMRVWQMIGSDTEKDITHINAKLKNPLAGLSKAQLYEDAARLCTDAGMPEMTETMQRAALIAQAHGSGESGSGSSTFAWH
jgi:hypothetical protein